MRSEYEIKSLVGQRSKLVHTWRQDKVIQNGSAHLIKWENSWSILVPLSSVKIFKFFVFKFSIYGITYLRVLQFLLFSSNNETSKVIEIIWTLKIIWGSICAHWYIRDWFKIGFWFVAILLDHVRSRYNKWFRLRIFVRMITVEAEFNGHPGGII